MGDHAAASIPRLICLGCSCGLVPNRVTPPLGMKSHKGRGLCRTCYERIKKRGQLHEYPRLTSPELFLEDINFLIDNDVHPEHWASRLGTTNVALARRLYRAGLNEYASAIERIVSLQRRQNVRTG